MTRITIEDLLTFKLGFGAILAPPDTYPIQTAEKTGILFTQRAMTSPQPPQIFLDFWEGAYGAVEEA